MKTRWTILFLLAISVMAIAVAAVIKDRPSAVSNGSDILVRWTTEDESGVQAFVIVRRAGVDGEFLPIATVSPKGNNSMYEYADRSVFKATGGIFQYRVRVQNGSNPLPESEIVTVSHVSSAARRTWGSIKAMFR